MVKWLLAVCPAISATLATQIFATHHHMNSREGPTPCVRSLIVQLRSLLLVLEPLCKITKHISGQQYPLNGKVAPIIHNVISTHLEVTVGENTMISNFKANVRDDLNSCWETITTQMPIQILLAVYLDPQLKDFAFIRDAEKCADCIQKGKASVLAQLQDVDVPAVPAV